MKKLYLDTYKRACVENEYFTSQQIEKRLVQQIYHKFYLRQILSLEGRIIEELTYRLTHNAHLR